MENKIRTYDSIGIVNYGMGNLRSVKNALEFIGVPDVRIISDPEQLSSVDRIILPGVGAFKAAMEALGKNNMIEALTQQVIKDRKPFLGICLGMQLIAKSSEEGGLSNGLGWIDARVIPFSDIGELRIPHIGWNNIRISRETHLLEGVENQADFYFVHGYHVHCGDKSLPLLTCHYGKNFTAALKKDNILATQFHPEKSQRNGLKLLENFAQWRPFNA